MWVKVFLLSARHSIIFHIGQMPIFTFKAIFGIFQSDNIVHPYRQHMSSSSHSHPHAVGYKLSKSEILNITVRGRLCNPLRTGRSRLTASGARANANSIRVLTSVNQFRQIQTTWLFFMSLTSSRARKHAIYSYETWSIRGAFFHYCNVVK